MLSLRRFLSIRIMRSQSPRLNVDAKIASRAAKRRTISSTPGHIFRQRNSSLGKSCGNHCKYRVCAGNPLSGDLVFSLRMMRDKPPIAQDESTRSQDPRRGSVARYGKIPLRVPAVAWALKGPRDVRFFTIQRSLGITWETQSICGGNKVASRSPQLAPPASPLQQL